MRINRAETISRLRAALVCLAVVASVLTLANPQAAAQDGSVRLNEVQSSNATTLVDAAGATPDWIELFNASGSDVDLAGWSLTDDVASPQKWLFPAGSTVGADSFVIVFASGSDVSANGELHTNFKLSAAGEFVGLFNPAGDLVSSFDPVPALLGDFSWGVDTSDGLSLFEDPTPGAVNIGGSAGLLADVSVVPGRGFYESAQQVTLSAEPGAAIRYTLDGSEPSATNGALYSGPITVGSTAVLRALATRVGWSSPKPVTHSFLFADDVVDQPEMDPTIVASNRSAIVAGLQSLPVISLTALNDDGTPRQHWSSVDESPVAVEMIFPDGTSGFQVDAGAKEVGGSSVHLPKDSLRLKFGSEWGESRLDYPVFGSADNPNRPAADSFKRLTLRTGSHDSGFWQYYKAPFRSFLRTRWHDETMLDLGHSDTHGRFVNVFLNGQYWGQYHLREHLDDHFMASYHGGDNDDYVGINKGVVSVGTGTSWDALSAASSTWAEFAKIVDPINYVDFMLVSEYGGNNWDLSSIHNWRGAGPATVGTTSTGYVFNSSDPDIALVSPTATMIDPGERSLFDGPAGSWLKLLDEQDPAFMALVADRAELLFSDGGALSEAGARLRWDRLADTIETSVHAEYARWGQLSPVSWNTSMSWFRETLFAARTDFMVNNLTDRGVIPTVARAGVATQSSNYNAVSTAGLATDGRTLGDWADGSVAMTAIEEQPWWQLDLGEEQPIDGVRLWNRTDCCAERLSGFHVFVSSTPFTSETVAGTQSQPGVSDFYFSGTASESEDIAIGRSGRYVRVQLAGRNYLALAEVGVFVGEPNQPPVVNAPATVTSVAGDAVLIALSGADPDGQHVAWSDAVLWPASSLPPGVKLDVDTGVLSGVVTAPGFYEVTILATDVRGAATVAAFEWTVDQGEPHLGESGTAIQSSTYGAASADRAIDGNPDGDWGRGSVTHTHLEDEPWWQVDLGARSDIGSIRLWSRSNCCPDRLGNFHVFVSDDPFVADTVAATQAQVGVSDYFFAGNAGVFEDIAIGRAGRYVRVQLDGTNYLSIAEAQLFAPDVPNATPLIQEPTSRSSIVDRDVWLPLSAVDPEGEALRWSAAGLPRGLTLDEVHGVISGAATQAGTFNATLTVTDPRGAEASTTLEWTSRHPQPHLGQSGVASQSSVGWNAGPERASDGDTNGLWHEGSIAHTGAEVQPWWQVDLGAAKSIDSIRLWSRTYCCPERLTDVHVFVSDDPFTSDTVAGTQAQPGVSDFYFAGAITESELFSVRRSGRYVRVQLEGTGYLHLAEAEIFEGLANDPPVVDVVGAQSALVGEDFSLPMTGRDPEGGSLTWSANGLPAGLVIDSATGRIDGVTREAGTFAVAVTATDGVDAAGSTLFDLTLTYPSPSRLILNEWNAVDKDVFLKNGGTDSALGTVVGNGGDWFELVVIQDHLDVRGWSLEISDADTLDGAREVTDTFVFADQPLLADLRAGTIITVSEDFVDDPSFDPASGDWHINLQANSADAGAFFTTDSQSNFAVNNQDWQLLVRDGSGAAVFGPAGEGISTSGVGGEEVGELEADPGALISPVSAFDDGDSSTFGEPNGFDGRLQDFSLLRPALDDTTEPDSVISSPLQGEVLLDASVTISGTATDDVGVSRVSVSIRNKDTGEWLRRDGSLGAFQFIDAVVDSPGAVSTSWTFTHVLAEGTWIVSSRAEDTSGNRDSTRPNRRFVVEAPVLDTAEPDGEILSPTRRQELTGPAVSISGAASDDIGVDRVRVSIQDLTSKAWLNADGSFGNFARIDVALDLPGAPSSDWSYDVELPEGSYAVVVDVIDSADKQDQTRARVPFTVTHAVADGVAPDTTLDSPLAREALAGPGVTVVGAATDNVGVARVRVTVQDVGSKLWMQDDGSFADTVALVDADLDSLGAVATGWSLSVSLPPGNYAVAARAVDAVGNTDDSRPRVRFSVTG